MAQKLPQQIVLEIKDWLKSFEKCVNEENFDEGRTMYCDEAVYFGSFTERMTSLDELIERQWKQIWPNITDFHFQLEKLHYELLPDGNSACVMVPWTSTGYAKDGSTFERPGRVTILLIWDTEKNSWIAKHTHYSLTPNTPTTTHKASS